MEQQELPDYSQETHSEPQQEEHQISPDVLGNWKIVDLPVVVPYTGQEEETLIKKFRVKLYRFKDEEWKERGLGPLKFLKHNVTGMIRMVVRAQKLGYVILNHNMIKKDDLCEIKKQLTQEKAWSWKGKDISDGHPNIYNFCARFITDEDYQSFAIQFNKACEENMKTLEEAEKDKEEQKQDD